MKCFNETKTLLVPYRPNECKNQRTKKRERCLWNQDAALTNLFCLLKAKYVIWEMALDERLGEENSIEITNYITSWLGKTHKDIPQPDIASDLWYTEARKGFELLSAFRELKPLHPDLHFLVGNQRGMHLEPMFQGEFRRMYEPPLVR